MLFTGDVMMPFLGATLRRPKASPEGLLETLAFIGSLRPRLLIHGHATLTENFTAGAVAGLEAALTQLHGEVLDGIRGGRTLPDILAEASLPAVLREHPPAVVPYLVIRDHFTERLYHQRTGYWPLDGRGLEPSTAAERAAALDLLAGGRAEQFAAAAGTLIGQGDHALALEIIEEGLLRHPASTALAGLRRTALHRLMEQYQQSDPFKFLIYADSPAPRSARPSDRRAPGCCPQVTPAAIRSTHRRARPRGFPAAAGRSGPAKCAAETAGRRWLASSVRLGGYTLVPGHHQIFA